ncbi:MAG: zf-HC2 domain-containing protein [Jatrophihabitans sp.]
MTDRCDAARFSLGAYALGALERADQHLVEAHLASCPDCLTELTELKSVVPALASLSVDDVSSPTPSPALFARIAGAVEVSEPESSGPESEPADLSAKRRLRSKRWLVAVAASVVLAGGGTAIGIAVSSSWSQPATTIAGGTAGDVHLRVAATDAKSGTRLELTSTGLPRHEHCRLVALAADGSSHDAGSWDASYEGRAQVTESTDVPRSELRRLTLYGDHGKLLVTVTL